MTSKASGPQPLRREPLLLLRMKRQLSCTYCHLRPSEEAATADTLGAMFRNEDNGPDVLRLTGTTDTAPPSRAQRLA